MPMITLTFNYPQAPLPRYKFGDRVAVFSDCPPTEWLTGKVVGLILNENQQPYWYYSVKLNTPCGLTEEYLGDDLVPESEILSLQIKREKDNCNYALSKQPSPKFSPGMLVKFTIESGCNLLGGFAQVVSSRYVSSEDWSGFVYKLTNARLSEPIEIGEPWLERILSNTEADTSQGLAEKERG